MCSYHFINIPAKQTPLLLEIMTSNPLKANISLARDKLLAIELFKKKCITCSHVQEGHESPYITNLNLNTLNDKKPVIL
jgi:hypothetical protein